MPRIIAKDQIISTVVRDRTGVLFEGKIESLTSFNDKGEFDVLPMHTNFISIIHKEMKIRDKGEVVKSIELKTGILTVRDNSIEVFLGILH